MQSKGMDDSQGSHGMSGVDNLHRKEYNSGSMHDIPIGSSAPHGPDFYREGSKEEARRLDLMATIANEVSLDMIAQLASHIHSEPFVVADVGAGDSPRFGLQLTKRGYAYRPIDMRLDAIEAQRQAGFDATQSIATELSTESDTVGLVHARFTWGWLSDAERKISMAEMVRVGHDDMALTVIDYDWNAVEGPQLFRDMVANLMGIMRQTGFEPEYGARIGQDLHQKLSYLVEGPHEVTVTRTPTYDGPIEGGVAHFIAPTIDAIVTQLVKIGRRDQAATLINDLVILQDYAVQHPEERVRLPEIVAAGTVILAKSQRLSPAMRTYLDARGGAVGERRDYDSFVEGIDFERALPDIESAHRVAIATSDEMILAARRIQTTAYYKDEIIGFDAVGDNGVLVDGNDPLDLVHRSIYFVPLNERTQWMSGVVRIITPEQERGVWSLPTIQRIAQHSPEAAASLLKYPFMNSEDGAVEVSGLAKNMLGGSLEDVMVAMVVLAEVTVRNGYRFGVMGLQESKVELIEHLFGTSAVRRIDGEEVVHHIDLPGVKEDAMFVPLYVDGATFVQDVHEHASKRQGKLFATLARITGDILSARDLDSRFRADTV